MHSAPAVNYPVGRSRMACGIVLAIWGLSACCICAWRYQNSSNDWRWAVVLGAFLIGTGAAAWAWRRFGGARGVRWDGAAWSVDGVRSMSAARAMVALDLQTSLLIRFDKAGRASQWLWLDRCAMPERWNAVRRAVYCRAPELPDVGQPTAAAPSAPRTPDLPA